LFNNGFDVPDNEEYNVNLGNNFVRDLSNFRDQLPPITVTEPVEIIYVSRVCSSKSGGSISLYYFWTFPIHE
jgi:hypothetical protein